jgi:hypothetical protein
LRSASRKGREITFFTSWVSYGDQPRAARPGGFKLGPMVKLTAPYYVREFKKQKSERFTSFSEYYLLRGANSDPLRTCAAGFFWLGKPLPS